MNNPYWCNNKCDNTFLADSWNICNKCSSVNNCHKAHAKNAMRDVELTLIFVLLELETDRAKKIKQTIEDKLKELQNKMKKI